MAQHIPVSKTERPEIFQLVEKFLTAENIKTAERISEIISMRDMWKEMEKNSFEGKRFKALHTLDSSYLMPNDIAVISIGFFDFTKELGDFCSEINIEVHVGHGLTIDKIYAVA